MPVYAGREKGTWRVVVWHKGRSHERVVEGRKKDAETFEGTLRAKLEAGEGVQDPRRVPEFLPFCAAEYVPHAELHLKPYTFKQQQHLLANLSEFFGDSRLSEIDASAVDRYAKQRKSDGLKAVSINNEIRVLKRVLNFAREDRSMNVPKPKWKSLTERGGKRVKAWDSGEVAKFLDACVTHSPATLPLAVFLLNTGARKGEAIALTWDHVDLRRGMVQIHATDDDEDEKDWSPKNERAREVPIAAALEPFLTAQRAHAKWVFPTPTRIIRGRLAGGGRYAEFPKRGFNRARAVAGVKGGPHTLRHTFATHFLQGCPDLFLLAKLLGHSYERVTELYSHLLPDHLARARDVVNFASPVGPAAVAAATRWTGSR